MPRMPEYRPPPKPRVTGPPPPDPVEVFEWLLKTG